MQPRGHHNVVLSEERTSLEAVADVPHLGVVEEPLYHTPQLPSPLSQLAQTSDLNTSRPAQPEWIASTSDHSILSVESLDMF